MNLQALLYAAILLSLERLCYIWVWRFPESFRMVCRHPAVAALGDPVTVLRKLFYCFKGLQLAVFVAWCSLHDTGVWSFLYGHPLTLAAGGAAILAGQFLNFSVFYRLGRVGVFYGSKFGHKVPWCRDFPFSLLKHPQYVGTVLSIWGFFLIMRFPYADWYVLPVLETAYYTLGIHFER